MSAIVSNLQAVRSRIASAAQSAGRSAASVRLVAVAKTFGAAAIIEAISGYQHDFAENYLQEALAKQAEVRALMKADQSAPPLVWHMIGPLQSNKTRAVAENFDWVHSVERIKIAERLSDQRPQWMPPLAVCLQVNVSGEHSKSGVAPEHLVELAEAVRVLPRLRLAGLMAIPEPSTDFERQRTQCAMLFRLRQELLLRTFEPLELSMGMSDDLEAAILEGATMVRVGSAIFGARMRAADSAG